MHSRHSGTQALKALEGHVRTPTLRVLGHLVHSGTQVALGNLGTQGTWARKALGHSKDTLALGHSRHLGTWALGHLATQRNRGTLFSRLFQEILFLY